MFHYNIFRNQLKTWLHILQTWEWRLNDWLRLTHFSRTYTIAGYHPQSNEGRGNALEWEGLVGAYRDRREEAQGALSNPTGKGGWGGRSFPHTNRETCIFQDLVAVASSNQWSSGGKRPRKSCMKKRVVVIKQKWTPTSTMFRFSNRDSTSGVWWDPACRTVEPTEGTTLNFVRVHMQVLTLRTALVHLIISVLYQLIDELITNSNLELLLWFLLFYCVVCRLARWIWRWHITRLM